MSQCRQCQRIGPLCHCEMCDAQRDPNQLCPWCQRDHLFVFPGRLQCDHCSYVATTERHQATLQALRDRQAREDQAKQAKATNAVSREIVACYQETTIRRSPGGNDATGTAKEDKLSGTSLAKLKQANWADSGIVSTHTLVIRPADSCRVQVPGSRPMLTPLQVRQRLEAEVERWKAAKQSPPRRSEVKMEA